MRIEIKKYIILHGWMSDLYCNYHMKLAFHNIRSMMHSSRMLGNSGLQNDTFFDLELQLFDQHFQASFLVTCWFQFGAKKEPQMNPQSPFLKIRLGASWATLGASCSTWGPIQCPCEPSGRHFGRFGLNLGAVLLQFCTIGGQDCSHLG